MNIFLILILQMISVRGNRFRSYMNHHRIKVPTKEPQRTNFTNEMYLKSNKKMLTAPELHQIIKDINASFPAHLQVYMLKMRLFKIGKGFQVTPGIVLSNKELIKNIPTIFHLFA